MITFGLTGGIACGKSTVTKTFIKHGIPMVDADVVAREVVEVGKPAWRLVRACFGNDYLNEDESINRIKLGELVFSNEEQMRHLNFIMGPAINSESDNQIKAFHDAGHSIVGYDAALICEMGNAGKYRPLIVVQCPRDMQVERLIKRNGLTQEQAVARISAQMSVEEKLKLADFSIDTSGTIENSVKQTEHIISILKWAVDVTVMPKTYA